LDGVAYPNAIRIGMWPIDMDDPKGVDMIDAIKILGRQRNGSEADVTWIFEKYWNRPQELIIVKLRKINVYLYRVEFKIGYKGDVGFACYQFDKNVFTCVAIENNRLIELIYNRIDEKIERLIMKKDKA
jgi:hypothetical protein